MVITEPAKNSCPKEISNTVFDGTVHDHCLEEDIHTLTAEATWLNVSPERRELCFAPLPRG